MNSALQVLAEFEASSADGFPLGQQGAEVLEALERITKLVEEAKAFYKAQLARDLHCVPGWTLKPGAVRRSLGDPQRVWEKLPLPSAVGLPLAESQRRRLKDVMDYQKDRQTFLR
jgi:hypothetical protein